MQVGSSVELEGFVRSIPDFPKTGILYRDITPLLASPQAFRAAVAGISNFARSKKVEVVAAAEARGFIFAAPVALELGVGFVPIRKPGKLPSDKLKYCYELEYGSDCLEVHRDGFSKGQRVLLIDDLLATGGTMEACCQLVSKAGADVVACAFLIELKSLCGREKLKPMEVHSLVAYP